MPGFGTGAFGQQRFGSFAWSRMVLFEYIPQIYRDQDAQPPANGALEAYSESLRPSFDGLRQKVGSFRDLRDPLHVRTQYNDVQSLRLGRVVLRFGAIEQRGSDAVVTLSRQFFSATARFQPTDLGKTLTVSGSAIPGNNREVLVASVIGPNIVITDPQLAIDTGPMRWELKAPQPVAPGVLTVEVEGGDVSAIAPGWILSDGFADFEVRARRIFEPLSDERKKFTDRDGTDGFIDSSGRFGSPTAGLTEQDIGQRVSITVDPNNLDVGVFEITGVVQVNPGDVRAVFTPALTFGSGPLVWALLPKPQLDIVAAAAPRGVVQQSGIDMIVTAASVVTSLSAQFTTRDVGKVLTLYQAAAPFNNVLTRITGVVDAQTVQVDAVLSVSAVPLFWEVRQLTGLAIVGSPLLAFQVVQVRAQSLIALLADDFAIPIDTQETEARQRSWVANVSQWIGLKGTAKGYQILGNISGFDVQVAPLFRIDQDIGATLGPHAIEIEDLNTGRYGSDGVLTRPTSRVVFSSPTATFAPTDVGRLIRIKGTSVSPRLTVANDKLYTVEAYLSPTSVEFRFADSATTPDGNNGTLLWSLVTLYADEPPLLPRFDEVNSDLMSSIVGPSHFGVDLYCWDPASIDQITATISAVSPAVPQPFPVTYTVTVTGDANVIPAPDVTQGFDGSLTTVAGRIRFNAPSATFSTLHVGKAVRVFSAGVPANDTSYVIESVIDATTVELVASAAATTPDPNNGALTWGLLLQPAGTWQIIDSSHIAIASQTGVTASIIAGAAFGNMRVAGLTGVSSESIGHFLTVTGASFAANNGTFQIVGFIDAATVDVVNGAAVVPDGNNGTIMWTEKTGVTFFVETIPIALGGGQYSLTTSATKPPVVGASTLKYVCKPALSCGYCAASVVLVTLEASAELLAEGGQAIENVFERVVARMRAVTPAHVLLVFKIVTELTAPLNLQATIEKFDNIYAILYAPLSPLYDDVPADAMATDFRLTASVTPI